LERDLGNAPRAPAASGSSSWSDLRLRLRSALLLAPIGLICIWRGEVSWAVLLLAATVGLAREWELLCRMRPVIPRGLLVAAMAVPAVAIAAVGLGGAAIALLLVGAIAVGLASGRIALGLGIPYIGLAGIALVWLRQDAVVGRWNVLFVIFVVWASDIGAYVAGRLIGGPKLAPRISPGKTWAGAAGGLIAAAAVGLAAGTVSAGAVDGGAVDAVSLLRAALVAAALGVVSQAGDLGESAVKRRFGVKDSGGLIPGHGGLLDRLDGVLTAAPAAALIALALGPGVALWQ
jgi:phosphatidate cytidylyltransferase